MKLFLLVKYRIWLFSFMPPIHEILCITKGIYNKTTNQSQRTFVIANSRNLVPSKISQTTVFMMIGEFDANGLDVIRMGNVSLVNISVTCISI